jgi:hypothetical protein
LALLEKLDNHAALSTNINPAREKRKLFFGRIKDRVFVVVSGNQGTGNIPLMFTSSGRAAEFIARHKPGWATAVPRSFDQEEFAAFLWQEYRRYGRSTHFALNPPPDGGRLSPYPIARFLSDPAALATTKVE